MSGYAVRARRPGDPWIVLARYDKASTAMLAAMRLATDPDLAGVMLDVTRDDAQAVAS